MKKRFTLITAAMMLLTILAVPIGMRGQTTVVYPQTSTTEASVQSGTAPAGSSVTFTTTYSNMNQLTEGNSMTLTLSGYEGNKITGITLSMRSNSSKGAGSLSVTAGSTTIASIANAKFNTSSWYGAWSTSYVDVAVTMSNDSYVIQDSENVMITIAATENSLYCNAFKITYESSSTISTTTTIVDSGITNTNKFVSTEAGLLSATVTETTSGNPVDGATVAWSGNNDAVATINASTGVVTLVGAGIVTFTASYAGNATHSPSSNTYELTVTNENPALVTIWSENFSSYDKDDMPSGGTYGYVCTNGGGTTKIYTENNAGGTSPELLVGKTNGAFEATVPLLTSTYGYSGDLTLTFKSNAYSINVKSGTSGITVDGEASPGAGVTFNTKDTHTVTFKGTTVDNENVNIEFTATTGSNVRIDDIVLKGLQAPLTKVATPTISPAGGTVVSGTEVTMTCLTDGATIYYTTDDTPPTSSSTPYNPSSKPTITANTTFKAIGVKGGLTDSDVATATYTIAEPCATPTFSEAAGEVDPGTIVTISTGTGGATIYYTTDGTDPTTSSSVYSSAITINTAMTLKAIAAKDGMANSAVASVSYTVRDYANLPLDYNNGKATLPTGFTSNGLGSDYSGDSKLKFDDTGDYLILKTNEAPASLSYTIKGNGFSGGTFKVQTSADGVVYSDLATYTSLAGSNQTYTHLNLASDVRYIKWIYMNKSSGNVGLGNFKVHTVFDVYGTASIGNFTPTTEKKCTIYNGGKLTVDGTLTNATAANLIIENGGQLYTESAGVKATVKKDITGYGNDVSVKHGWNLIALPVTEEYTPAAPMTSNEYDLYYLDNTIWRNYKNNTFNLVNGKGYLYANSDNVTLTFAGTVKPYTGSNTVDLTDGWNLVGNPYTFNVYSNKSFYKITTDGEGNNVITVSIASDAITPCRGIVVRSDGASTLAFNKTAGEWSKGNINLALSQQVVTRDGSREAVIDNAIVSFNEGSELEKFYFGESNANVYIPQGNNEYAIVTSDGKNGIPVNFKAAENGTYTLSFEVENTEMNYLHLIDKLTGNDIDLLATPEYTFSAKNGDGENRFRLVFEANGNALVTSNEPFAYFNGSEWVIENDGNATLQVIDVMGRMLRSENVSGNATTSLPNLSAGVYVLRLVNSESIKTQKVVIE